jgi:hypothetical protein
VDGAPAAWHGAGGLVAIDLPAGAHDVRLRQAPLPEEWAGAAVTLLALAALATRRRDVVLSQTAASA